MEASGTGPRPRRILVVCTANQCRSPMAEGLIRAALAEQGLGEGFELRSAGTRAWDGVPATPDAIETLRARGIDIAGHRSSALDAGVLGRADLVLAMTAEHAREIDARFPGLGDRLCLMSALAGGAWDVEDPVGLGPAAYAATADALEALIRAGWPLILGSGPG